MSSWRMAVVAATAVSAWASPSYADECEAITASLSEKLPKLHVAARHADDQTVVVELNATDAKELSLTCAADSHPPVVIAAWAGTWPPATFYDLVASVGAIVAANSEPAIRSGAVICAQRAMTADGNSAVFDVNGVRFQCTTTTGVGATTRIRLSKLTEPPASQPQ